MVKIKNKRAIMGIKNLSQFLRKREVYETLKISTLKFAKLGIDAPMFLYKFKGVTDPNTNDWLGCFVSFVTFLRKNDMHPVFVFEGRAPPEKSEAQVERREQKMKLVGKTNSLEQDLNEYISSGTISPLLEEIWEKIQSKSHKNLLAKSTIVKSFIDVDEVREDIERRRRQEIRITRDDISNLKKLLKILGVSFIQSDGEAETDCVSLFYDGIVDYVVSEDSDILAYFQPFGYPEKDLKTITHFNAQDMTFTQISKQKVLSTLNLSAASFRDFCIMCGTDYNKNMFRVGVEKSYKLITTHFNIENVPLDTEILNHVKVRELFEVKTKPEIVQHVKWCRFPTKKFRLRFTEFMTTFNLQRMDVEFVYNALAQPDIGFFQELKISD